LSLAHADLGIEPVNACVPHMQIVQVH